MWTSKESVLIYGIILSLVHCEVVLSVSAFLPTRNNNRPFYSNAPTTTHSPTSLRAVSKKNAYSLSSLPSIEGIRRSIQTVIGSNEQMNFKAKPSIVISFLNAVNEQNIDEAMTYIIDSSSEEDGDSDAESFFEYEDTDFPNAWYNPRDLERNLRLQSEINSMKYRNPRLEIDQEIYDPNTNKCGVVFHEGSKKGVAFFTLNDFGLIRKAFIVKENDKSGESSLKVLKMASEIMSVAPSLSLLSQKYVSCGGDNPPTDSPSLSSLTLPEQYFNWWNQRDMKKAVSVFAENVEYDDTAFPEAFTGKAALERHLNICADSMPSSFSFVVDDKIDIGNRVMVLWHVENNAEELPYTRGCSWYVIEKGKIARGMDLKEPAVFKTGGISLFVNSFLSKLVEEPIRLVPFFVWGLYIYVVFFSSWFFGLPATALELRTWEEVRDLSLNFFLVSPILSLPFAPVIHPGLEGIFNLLLSWAALFAGFLSDDRKRKPNLLPMLPIVIGMQFLTSAFLLPYLATRSAEGKAEEEISRDELSVVARVTESKILSISMGIVGIGSIFWGLFARTDDFGDLTARYSSLVELLSIDRVGSSFLVDLAIFGLFQGWLVDDDVKRRRMESDSMLTNAAKYVPFFGLVTYLTFRSELPVSENER